MEKQFLFENEEILISSGDSAVILTNRRIRQTVSSLGNVHITSMHLENISTIEINYRSWPLMLVLGIICVLGSVLFGQGRVNDVQAAGLFIGLFFILFYFISRRHLITIGSDGGIKINMLIKNMSKEDVLSFVNKIEYTKSRIK